MCIKKKGRSLTLLTNTADTNAYYSKIDFYALILYNVKEPERK